MNMTQVLHRRSNTNAAESDLRPTPDFVPPSLRPPESGNGRPSPWPVGAKVLIAILLVAAVLGTVGAAIAFGAGDDGSTERRLQDRIATLTAERDSALDAVDELDAELVVVQQQLRAAQAGGDDLAASVDELEARVATLTDQRDAAAAMADQLEVDVETLRRDLNQAIDERDSAFDRADAAEARTVAAIAERDALVKLFPMKFDASIGNVATAGTYDISLSQVYCSGLTSCGKALGLKDPTIRKSAEGNLRIDIPGFVEGGLFRADGALHMVADSNTAVPACNGTSRPSRVVMSIFPGSYSIGSNGARDVVSLGAVVTVEAPAVGNCPAVLAFYSAELTR